MGRANQSIGRKLDRFLIDLSALVETLPSPDAKAQIDQDLASLIKFLQDFRDRLKSLPTDNDLEGVTSTIEAVRDCVRIAEADPAMSRILGLSSELKRPKKSLTSIATKKNREIAKSVADELREMPPENVEQVLADKRKYSVSMLRQIGGELGITLTSNSTRLAVIEKISKTLSNRWGYDYLSNGGAMRVARPKAHDRSVSRAPRNLDINADTM